MVQLVDKATDRVAQRRQLTEDDLWAPPDIIPPEREARMGVWASLLFVGGILAITTVTSAMISAGVFALIIVPLTVAITLLLLRRPAAQKVRLRRARPEQVGATPEQIDHLRRDRELRQRTGAEEPAHLRRG